MTTNEIRAAARVFRACAEIFDAAAELFGVDEEGSKELVRQATNLLDASSDVMG